MEDEFEAFVSGVFIACVVIGFLSMIYWFGGGNTHDLSWDDKACVVTTDRLVDGVATSTTHCVTAQELAKWAQERGR